MYHKSVLLNEFLTLFSGKILKVFVDGTLGAGGHAEAILQTHPEIELFIGIDQDPDALKIAEQRLAPFKGKCRFLRGNFSEIRSLLQKEGVKVVDGILVDIGVSSMQIDRPERGFSFQKDGPLDMRMDPQAPVTAADIVNEWEERDLGLLFRDLGEEKMFRKAAKAIVEHREKKPFETTGELAACLQSALKMKPPYKLHPATLVFQALRIEVNGELVRLKQFLPNALQLLKPGGILSVISFHSLEDRIVKNAFAYYASDKESTSGIGGMFIDKKPEARLLTRKPIEATDDEVIENPRSRSAKMRALEKL